MFDFGGVFTFFKTVGVATVQDTLWVALREGRRPQSELCPAASSNSAWLGGCSWGAHGNEAA